MNRVNALFLINLFILLQAFALSGCTDNTNFLNGKTTNNTPIIYRISAKSIVLENTESQTKDGVVSLHAKASGDLNNDQCDDFAAVLRQNSQGSGVFYYLNVFLGDCNGQWQFLQEAFLGDRIKIDFIDIYGEGSVSLVTGVAIHSNDYGQVSVGYFLHRKDQPFAEPPALFITRQWKVEAGKLAIVDNY